MKIFDEELFNSKFITIDEKGWHISKDAPEELKKKFNEFIKIAQTGIVIEIK